MKIEPTICGMTEGVRLEDVSSQAQNLTVTNQSLLGATALYEIPLHQTSPTCHSLVTVHIV